MWKVKPKKRKVEKLGKGILSYETILFRGQKYYFFRQGWRQEAKILAKRLMRDGYKIRLTKGTFDGTVLNVYVRPQIPEVPHYKAYK